MFKSDYSLKLFVTIDSSGPTLALDTTSATCRSVFAELRSQKITLSVPRYTPIELLSTGICNGKFLFILIFIIIIIIIILFKVVRIIIVFFQMLVMLLFPFIHLVLAT